MQTMSSTYINEHVGKAIRDIRNQRSMTLNELALRMRLSYQQLQKYEKGTNRLSIDKLYEIAKVLGVEVSSFFPGGAIPKTQDDMQKLIAADCFSQIADKELRELLLKLLLKLGAKEPESQA